MRQRKWWTSCLSQLICSNNNVNPFHQSQWTYEGTCNSVKLLAMPCRASQIRQVIVKSSDKTRSTGEGNGNPPQYSRLEKTMSSMKSKKKKKIWHLKMNPQVRRCPICYWGRRGINNSSAKNEMSWPKQKKCSVVDVSCGVSKSLMLYWTMLHMNLKY